MGPLGQKPTRELEWDETGHNVISHINVSFDKCGVTSIQFGYVENGALVMSKTYGLSSAVCSRRIVSLIIPCYFHCKMCNVHLVIKSTVEAEP